MSDQKKMWLAVVVLAVAGLLISRAVLRGRVQGKAPTSAWFYDLHTGELFAGPADAIPPIAVPSDPAAARGVRAHVFTCTSCDPRNRTVMYLQRDSESARRARAAIDAATEEAQKAALWVQVNQGQLLAAPPPPGKEPAWVTAASREGIALTQAIWTMCGDKGYGKLCAAE